VRDLVQGLCRVSCLDPAIAMRLAADLETLDQRKDEVGGDSAEAVQRLAALAAELLDAFARIELQPSNDLPAVAARSTPARRLGFEHDGVDVDLGKMQGGRETAESAADDRDVTGEILG